MLLLKVYRSFSRKTCVYTILSRTLDRKPCLRYATFSNNTMFLKHNENEKYISNLYERSRKTTSETNIEADEDKNQTIHVSEISPSSIENQVVETSKIPTQNVNDVSIGLVPKSPSNPALSTTVNAEFLNTISPSLPKTFNLAAYVDQSEILQQLVNLGVDLSRIEKRGPEVSMKLLKLDFEKNVKPRLQFLHSCGIAATDLGLFISKNPMIFDEDLEDMQARINYLKSKAFSQEAITRILNRTPTFINFNTKSIDTRLGYFQREYKLNGNEIRFLITKNPKLAIALFFPLQKRAYVIRDEMGFNEEEVKTLLLSKPKLWLLNGNAFKERFDYLHNTIGFSHKILVENPNALMFRKFLVQQRHSYLKVLRRDQYEPTKPNYVSITALVAGSDLVFCRDIAKTSVSDFNEYLKTI